jgi:hypothetical protein
VILLALLIIACGAIAAAGFIVKKQPNAQDVINKLVPYQGIMGAILGLWSIWTLIDGFRGLSAISRAAAFGLATGRFSFAVWVQIISSVVGIGLGLLLAYGLVNKYVLSGNAAAAEKGAQMQAKLVGVQIPLGGAGIACGILLIVARIML